MKELPPWTIGPFELILHAEGHLQKGEDFDRRISLISFDNSIEVSISTYLSLNPIQRGNRKYRKEDVEKWLNNYHTKLDFFEEELQNRDLKWDVEKAHIIWAHDHRNEQYHGGTKGTPEKQVLTIIKNAALWIFSVLYEIQNVEEILEKAIAATLPEPPNQPDDSIDRAIDETYEMIDIGGQKYYMSEVLFAVDFDAYRELGNDLKQKSTKEKEEKQ